MMRQFRFSLLVIAFGFSAVATAQTQRYFEGEIRIDKGVGSETCQARKTKDVQISWRETAGDTDTTIDGWIVFAGGSPGKLTGTRKGQTAALAIATNHYDKHFNTPATLSLTLADDSVTGKLQETPATLGFGESMCYWAEATLTLTDRTATADVRQRMKEHAAWYAAHAHESRGNHLARYHQFAQASEAYDQAIALVDGVIPEARAYFIDLLQTAEDWHAKAGRYARAAEYGRRLIDVGSKQSALGRDEPKLYAPWVLLATNLFQADLTAEALEAIEQAAKLEPQANGPLHTRLWRMRLHSHIHVATHEFEKALAEASEEIAVAQAEAGPDDKRTYDARIHAARIYRTKKDYPRFEEVFPPLANEIVARFGEDHALAQTSSALLGWHFYSTEQHEKALPWLERAFRTHRRHADSAAQAIKENEEARNVLAALIEIYIKQSAIPRDFLDRVTAGMASLDDLPFAAYPDSYSGRLGLPAELKKLLNH